MQPQRFAFLGGQLKHKILRKAVCVTPYGQVEIFGQRLVQLGQVRIKHDLLAADEVDAALDEPYGYGGRYLIGRLSHRRAERLCALGA